MDFEPSQLQNMVMVPRDCGRRYQPLTESDSKGNHSSQIIVVVHVSIPSFRTSCSHSCIQLPGYSIYCASHSRQCLYSFHSVDPGCPRTSAFWDLYTLHVQHMLVISTAAQKSTSLQPNIPITLIVISIDGGLQALIPLWRGPALIVEHRTREIDSACC